MSGGRKHAYSADEAAEVIGCSRDLIYRAVNSGALRTVPRAIAGNRVLIPVDALERQMANDVERRGSE